MYGKYNIFMVQFQYGMITFFPSTPSLKLKLCFEYNKNFSKYYTMLNI